MRRLQVLLFVGLVPGADLDQVALGVGDIAGPLAPGLGLGGQHGRRAMVYGALVGGASLKPDSFAQLAGYQK